MKWHHTSAPGCIGTYYLNDAESGSIECIEPQKQCNYTALLHGERMRCAGQKTEKKARAACFSGATYVAYRSSAVKSEYLPAASHKEMHRTGK